MFLKSVLILKIGMNVTCLRGLKRSFSVSSRETVKDLVSKDGELRVFIVAGEVSGDIIASRFMNSLKKLSHFPVRFTANGCDMGPAESQKISIVFGRVTLCLIHASFAFMDV